VIRRAKDAGVLAIINPAISPEDFEVAVNLARKYNDMLHIALGLAPQRAQLKDLDVIVDLADKYKGRYIAIGECGLDYYWVRTEDEIEKMRRIFKTMVSLASSYDLPMIIHSRSAHGRNAYAEIIGILGKSGVERAVFHAFFGRKSDALEITRRGWLIGIPTVYVRRRDLWGVLKKVPLENVLVETDSPYLSPTKGKRNEPANVVVLIDLLSKIRSGDPFDIAYTILENTKTFFEI